MTPPCVILSAPQMAENIGAVARAMANFGLDDLRIVKPRNGWPQRRAWETSSGADWILDAARVFDTVAEAIADLGQVHAATARPREMVQPVLTPRESTEVLRSAAGAGVPVGLLFGGERAGLDTADVALAHAIVTIPVDTKFASLNLAQAVVVNAYEWWVAHEATPPAYFREHAPPAPQAAVHGLYEHLERELDEAGFFFPPEKRPTMVRNLRVALGRAQLNDQEVRTFRGVVASLARGRGQRLQRLVKQHGEGEA